MRKEALALLAALVVPACGVPVDETDNALGSQPGSDNGQVGAPEPHVMGQRGTAGTHHTSSPDMTYGGGGVLRTNKTEAIFWGSEWSQASFQSDKVTGIDQLFSAMGGSAYEGDADEYYDSTGPIANSSTYLGHVFDYSAAPSRALSTSSAVAEACKIVGNQPDPNALYLIYTSTGAGHVNYCAWHTWGTCSNGAPIQVAYMPNLDGIAGCDPQDTWTTHSQGLAALANVTAHEFMETVTDPRGKGWTDSSGAENGDKCAWSFHNVVTLTDGSLWKLQMEWSNHAYDTNTGYPNTSGQNGCLQ